MDKELEKNTEIPKQGVIITLPVRCGSCYHFETRRADIYADVCKNLGILSSGRPCIKYLVNPKSMDLHDEQDKSMADIIGKIPANRLLEYAALMVHERTTRKNGFSLGEEVHVHLFPDNYLSNLRGLG